MRRFIIFLLIISFIVLSPVSALATSTIWNVSPANGTQTTDRHPTFTFDYSPANLADIAKIQGIIKQVQDKIAYLQSLGSGASSTQAVELSSLLTELPQYQAQYQAMLAANADEWSVVEVATAPGIGSDGSFYWENIALLSGPLDYPIKSYSDSFSLSLGHYYWHVRHYNYNEGNYSIGPTWELTIICHTSLRFSASPKIIKAGNKVTLQGQVKDTDGQPVTGIKVVIKLRTLKKTKKRVKGKIKIIKTWIWKTVAVKTTDFGGNFSFRCKPKTTSTYQAIFSGSDIFQTSSPKQVKVIVKK